MRVLDRGLGLVAAAVLAYAAGAAALAALRPGPAAGPVAGPARAAADLAEPGAGMAEPVWPALFGTAPAPEAAAPAAQVAEAAPEEAPKVVLAGIVVAPRRAWALLDWGQGQSAAQVGDLLPADTRIADITPEGVWLERAGLRWLVPAVPEGAGLPATRAAAADPAPAAQAAADEVTVPVGKLDRRALERLVARGGQMEDGADALVVTWVRAGQFFDRLGLKPGDSIIAINGQKVGGRAELTGAYDTAVRSGVMALDVTRGGAHRKIRVNLADI